MGWTTMQQAAIDKRGSNILVSAAAGSGKTAVLTERVFQRIVGSEKEEGIDIDHFLIVTFTSAAANEMKERIGDKIEKEVATLQEKECLTSLEREKMIHLERQLVLLPRASISTIHSFCLKVIKNYFNELDIDPNVKVGNMAELTMLKQDLLEELIEEQFDKEDNEAFLEVADIYAGIRGMEPLIELMEKINTFSKSTIDPKGWMEENVKKLLIPYKTIDEMPWGKEILEDIQSQIADLVKIYEEAVTICKNPDGPEVYLDVIMDDLMQIQKLNEAEGLLNLIEELKTVEFKRLPGKKQECNPVLKERVKSYRSTGKGIIEDLKKDTKFMTDNSLIQSLPKVGKTMQTLVGLIEEFEERYSLIKKEKGIMDYNDLEHLCLKVLTHKAIDAEGNAILVSTESAKELSEFYNEIYIDEYQDSNMVQETILNAVASAKTLGPTRFMVGDMKQSIYRFRLANPLIFAHKYNTWDKYTDGVLCNTSEGYENICIDLSQNFRSRKNILEGTNDLFNQIMSKQVGELIYDDAARLKVGNDYTSGNPEKFEGLLADTIELHIMENTGLVEENDGATDSEKEESELGDLKSIKLEAEMVSSQIDRLLKGEANPQYIYDKEIAQYRKVEPSDIVILLRSTANKANIFEEALQKRGIGAYAEVNSNFFEAMEIKTLLSLLQVIDNPRQDIPLLTLLRSPIVNFNFDELIKIRKFNEEGCFYEVLRAYGNEYNDEKILGFIGRLENYRDKSAMLSVSELVGRLFVETGYYRYVGMLVTGEKQQANLRMLKKYAEDFEASGNFGLFNFIQYMDKLRITGAKLEEAKLVGEGDNLVRIMTIHKSKGLEFPIVFLCDTAKKFNNQDVMDKVLLHNTLGFGPKYIDTEQSVIYDTIPFIAIKNKIIAENISEEMRVLYVALTRAKEKLFITGVVKNLSKDVARWSSFAIRNQAEILPLGIRKSPTYLNWIGMSLVALKDFDGIRSQMEEPPKYLFEGKSRWKMVVWNKEELQFQQEERILALDEKMRMYENWCFKEAYSPHKEEIYRRLNFEYAHQKATKLPTKVSVSEIKKQHYGQEQVVKSKQDTTKIPNFITLNTSDIQGARRGTMIHGVFEYLDLQAYSEYDAIKAEVERLVIENKISKEILPILDFNKLVSVAKSEVLARMRSSKKVHKEKSFVYIEKSSILEDENPEDETVLIQGVIDTFFIEEDGIVLIDYKTDYVDMNNQEESIKQIKERYTIQLELYAKALEGIMKLPVKEKMLYLYQIDTWIRV